MKTSDHFDKSTNHLATIKLPYPPSLNRYYAPFRGRPTITPVGRAYRQRVTEILTPQFEHIDNYATELQVWVEVMLPDRRRRDLDNLNKALLDAITHSGVWEDDSLIHDLRLVKVGVERPGFVRLHIAEITK